jgi:hypothetical protein
LTQIGFKVQKRTRRKKTCVGNLFMDMKQPLHILTKMGILATFSISKKITEAEVDGMMKTAKKNAKNEGEILELVKSKIMREIIDATHQGTLPGIILEKSPNNLPQINSIDALNHMVVVLSQKLKAKQIDKLSLCYFINYLIGSLGLVEADFEEFHRRIREARGEDDDGDDDE